MQAGADGRHFKSILQHFHPHHSILRNLVDTCCELDCLRSLSLFSHTLSYPKCRPKVIEASDASCQFFKAIDLRFPLLESTQEATFIPNDISLSADETSILLLTGPNMGGKSTILRQTCLAVILAQIGCYVPAKSCDLTVFDRIFTRLGAQDNIVMGRSTFMMEMDDVASVLKKATSRSLVVLDELGRGTSTIDGMAIAKSVMLYIMRNIKCLTMTATHYRPLALELESTPGVLCQYMACKAGSDEHRVSFLYKLVSGVSPKSFGLNVALMAGIKSEVFLNSCKLFRLSQKPT